MMNISWMFRIGATAVTGLLIAGSTAGCDTGSSQPHVIIEDSAEDGDAENNGDNGDNGDNGEGSLGTTTQLLMDEDIDLIDGYSDPIEVDVPDNAYSISISITDGDGNLNYMVTDWTAPDGFELVPTDWEDDDERICYPDCANRIMRSVGASGTLAPNNPDAEPGIQPGTHEFTIHSADFGMMLQEPGTALDVDQVRVLVHAELIGDAVPETGELDLNLFFTGSEGWTADSAEGDVQLESVINEIDELYDQVGIDIGEVAYHDVEGNYDIIEDMFTGTGDMAQMFQQSERAELNGPSVFFVEELSSPYGGGGAGGILGISGGIPGPMLDDGSVRSGVAIGTDSAGALGAPGIAKVTAHELGHYLGLFHTTEQGGGFYSDGPSHDPLPDTDINDESYLMHATGGGSEISEWQGRVMRKNPWVDIEDDQD